MKQQHYEQLTNITITIPKHNALLVIRNCHARLGPGDALCTFHERTNNGKLFLDHSHGANLKIATSRFQKKWRNFSPSYQNSRKSQIDYILIN